MSARIPRATYRLQLHKDFTFEDARNVLTYLERLGISDVYISPPFQAVTGSTHGYNLVSYGKLNSELGGEDAFEKLTREIRERGMGLLVDFVPNHMGIANGENEWWEDVLENGETSRYAHFFDIEWNPLKRCLAGKVLLPVLGDQYGRVLENGELKLERQRGRIYLKYYERRFPLSPRTLTPILERAAQLTGLDENDEDLMELASIATQARNLPGVESPDPGAPLTRAREKVVLRRRLRDLTERSEAVSRALDAAIAEWNAPENVDMLDERIQDQNYRLAFWRVATEEINYRRFFDINDLASVRMEDPAVFEAAHALLLQLLERGQITGVRLDHTDGLYDPLGYFQALQERRAQHTGEDPASLPLYVVAEKILEPGEHLPRRWPIHGTTGYDFLAQLNGVFVRTDAQEELTGIYQRFAGEHTSYHQTLHESKRLIMRASLASEINVLAERLERLAESNRRSRDFTLSALRTAIIETIAAFPVYRTYVRADGTRGRADNAHIEKATRLAKRRNRNVNASVFDFLADVLRLNIPDGADEAAWVSFALKFQQVTGPVTAKGVEDTSFYLYNRLVSLNEVGGDPELFGTTLQAFHEANSERAQHWRHTMLATSTHDTKRGEDTRARINVLSEMPEDWINYLNTWTITAQPYLRDLEGELAPDRNDQYMFYQNVLGSWPLDGNFEGYADRLVDYLMKAIREAKRHTAWTNQNTEYEEAIEAFARGMLADEAFMASMRELHDRISSHGAQNGLSTALVKFTAPGVPDTYQGSEVWNQSLVDPDNRRPVDYDRLQELTRNLDAQGSDAVQVARNLLGSFEDGTVKLLVTHKALQARRDHEALFRDGDYVPLDAGDHAIAFARTHGNDTAVTIAPRFTYTLTNGRERWAVGDAWGDASVQLPDSGTYRNLLTGEEHSVAADAPLKLRDVLRSFPLALLLKV